MSDIKGYFASSKAGHDKGTVYMILESDDVYVYLSDGKLRPTDKLKKKKLKHVQLIKQKDSDLAEKIEKNLFISNEEIKYAIIRLSLPFIVIRNIRSRIYCTKS